ncbi:MAG: TonB-dependent receptor, partial [Oceanococcus sp.]
MNKIMMIAAATAVVLTATPQRVIAQSDDELADLFGDDTTVVEQEGASSTADTRSTNKSVEETEAEEAIVESDLDVIPVGQAEDQLPGIGRARSRIVEEVIVTAQKREEDAQDVPIMINAFSGEKLDAFGIESTADLQKITPGLTYTYTYGYSVIYMRGVGTDAFLPNADPSVATYIDGINIGPSQGKQDTLGPVKRVEVLKGPQGTLFGRNATGGAINIVTEDPPDEFVANLKAEFGNFNSRQYQAYLASPFTEYFGATLALYKSDQDLFGRNEIYGGPGPMQDDFSEGGRLKLKLYPSDGLSLTLVGALSEQFNSNSLSQENTRPAPLFTGGVEADEPDRVWHNDYQGGNETTNTLYGATLEWLTDYADIKFIYSDNLAVVDEARYDYDSTETSQATFYSNDQYNDQQTYELQILSNAGSVFADHLEWVAGLYRLEGEGGFGSLYLTVNALGFGANATGITSLIGRVGELLTLNNLGGSLNELINSTNNIVLGNGGILTTESNAAYFQTTLFLTDWLDLTLGARYQEEVRGITNSYLDVVLPTAGQPPNDYYDRGDTSQNVRAQNFSAPDLSDKTWSPKVAIQFHPWDDIQIFASGQRAYKSPTYNIVNFFTDPDAVDREEATAFELGFKSDLFDNNLRLNAAIFHTKIKDLLTAIVSIGSGGIVTFRNAGEAEIKGAEIDLLWTPMAEFNPGLAIAAGATWLDAKYTDYPDGAGYDDDNGLYFGDDSLVGGPARDFTGNDIVRTPDLNATFSLNQFLEFGVLVALELGIDYYYIMGFNTTPQNSPLYEQPAYDLWSGRLS